MRRTIHLLTLSSALCIPSLAEEAPPPPWLKDWMSKMLPQVPRGYVCHYAANPPVIDGKLEEAEWTHTQWTEDFVDIEGAAKPAPRFRTRARMSWDGDYLYIGAEMEEPHVWGTLTKHDSVIFYDPDFEVFIDPNADSHEYFEFEMNALNTGWDLYLAKPYKDGVKADDSWEIPGLKTAVQVQGTLNDPSDKDSGWSVEIALPWKALADKARCPAPPLEGDQWRLGFSRVEWQIEVKDGKYVKLPNTPENNWIWSPQGVIDMHRPERWGYVQFTRKDPGSVKFIPDASAPVRDTLQTVYYAQKSFYDSHKRWAVSFEELEFKPEARPPVSAPVLKKTTEGYECEAELTLPGGNQQWSIRQDSLVRRIR